MIDYLIAPSILAANFARLGDAVDNLLEAGSDIFHFYAVSYKHLTMPTHLRV